MHEYLKIKSKTLAAEAKFIRLEERKAKARKRKELRQGLYEHRIHVVRREARSTHLCRGFLRGTPYRSIEHKAYTDPDVDAVAKMAGRYGALNIAPNDILKQVIAWRDAANSY